MVGLGIAVGMRFNIVLDPSHSHRREVRPTTNYVHFARISLQFRDALSDERNNLLTNSLAITQACAFP
jgi:hypothetical protein